MAGPRDESTPASSTRRKPRRRKAAGKAGTNGGTRRATLQDGASGAAGGKNGKPVAAPEPTPPTISESEPLANGTPAPQEPAPVASAPGPSVVDRVRGFWQRWIWRPAPPPPALPTAADVATEPGTATEAATAAGVAAEPLAGTIYLLPISHLDTQWRWTVRDTVKSFLPRTVRENAEAFGRFAEYCVNFDGAFRYKLLAEHYPEELAEVRRWVEAGRWRVTGATWDAMDVNLPSAESLIRQVLLGRRWFRQHLASDPRDLFLPDCFGFGAQVPTIAAHCGLLGFATSKLRRFEQMRSAFGIPFPIGWWEGPDGGRLLAILDPGGYGEPLPRPPVEEPEVVDQLRRHARTLGKAVAVRFFGIGDKGGAPAAKSLQVLAGAASAEGAVTTRAVGSDELIAELRAEIPAERFPVYRGELLLSLHGTGCYSSQAAMKRWNARNERLALAAERAAAAAAWLGGMAYPGSRLREAWQRFLWHQFHDDLTGTSIPAAYEISWHDEAIAASELGEVLRAAVGAIARGLDTTAQGIPLVVFNPLGRARHELVSARVPWSGAPGVEVIGPDGERVPAQLEPVEGTFAGGETGARGQAIVRFVAALPPLGCAVFDVRLGNAPAPLEPGHRLLPNGMETERYQLLLDGEGNLSSLWDRRLDRELLAAPQRLELFADRSNRYPAWEVIWEDLERGPVETVAGPAVVRKLPSGEAAVAIEVSRRLGRSRFVQRYRLAAGAAGDHLEVDHHIHWRQRGRLLKATFPLTAGAREAIYDAGAFGVGRGPSMASLYEVPAQRWADLTQEGGSFGAAVLSDQPRGWDHPQKHVLRSTLLRTPATGRRFPHQSWQDLGDHRFRLGLAGHRGDWRGEVPALGARWDQPPLAFVVPPARGPLGRSWSFLAVEGDAQLSAVKEHEEGGELVLRLLDPAGRGGAARIRTPAAVEARRDLDGTEDVLEAPSDGSQLGADGSLAVPMGVPASPSGSTGAAAAGPTGGQLDVQLTPFRPLTLGVALAPPATPLLPPRSATVPLAFDRAVVSAQGEPCRDGLGRRRAAFPAELFPAALELEGVPFALAGTARAHALACAGQRLALPAGAWDRLWLLATSAGDDLRLTFRAGGQTVELDLPAALAPLAQADRARTFAFKSWGFYALRPGFEKQAAVGWVAGHCHDAGGNDLPYQPACLFKLSVALPPGTTHVELPDAPQALLFAATVTAGEGDAVAVSPGD